MSTRTFDQKFGEGLLDSIGTGPGVYRYSNAEGVVIYVGKAKNLRRRLSSYRSAGRKKAHRKMQRVVKAAASLSFEHVETEEAALLLENALILELKPALNIDGAFTFLYPAIGVGRTDRHALLCFTTQPEEYSSHGLSWYGTFRSRLRAKLAFDALVELLGLIGHKEKRTALPAHAARRGSRFVGFRQLPPELAQCLPAFFAGEDSAFLGLLARALLAKPRARREAGEVEEKLGVIKAFFDSDAVRLREALGNLGRAGTFVPQTERDAIFIRSRFGAEG